MKAFLMSLKSFSVTIGGLIVVVIAVLLHGGLINLIQNFPSTFTLANVGYYLGVLILMFAIIWAQLKSNALLSHGILLYLFSSALSAFIGTLFSNTPSNAFDTSILLNLVVMLYTLGVVAAFILYDRPKPEKLTELFTIPLLIYFGALYVTSGFNTLLLSFLVVLVALLLGSKVVALAYALFTITSPIFFRAQLIIDGFTNDTPQQVSYWFILAVLVVSFVFLTLEFVKSIKADKA